MPRGGTGMRWHYWLIPVLLALVACAPATDEGLDNATISIVVPYRPGGGFDRTVRTFAPFFAQQVGSGVNVIPENVPGAGGQRGATKVYRAKPDGRTLGIFNMPGFVLPEVLGEQVDYDLRKLSWIGRLESQYYVLLVAGTSDLHSLEDVRALEDVTIVATGYGSTALAASQIAAESLQLADEEPIFLAGYAGTADYLVALIRGDGNVAVAPVSSALKYIESGDLRPIAVAGAESTLEGVPTFAELGYPQLTLLDIQRSIAGPPDMDPALLEQLRAAFSRAAADPGFVEAAHNARLDLSPLDGAATAAEVAQSFTFYEAFRTNLANPNAF